MTDRLIVRPSFSSEKEEADWWHDNQEYVMQEFDLAKAEGRLGHGTLKRRMKEMKTRKHAEIQPDVTEVHPTEKLAAPR